MESPQQPSLRRSFPPPGIPHLLFQHRSTTPGVGDQIRICLVGGCVCMTRLDTPLRFRDQDGVESDHFLLDGPIEEKTAQLIVRLICAIVGLNAERRISSIPTQVVYEFTYH